MARTPRRPNISEGGDHWGHVRSTPPARPTVDGGSVHALVRLSDDVTATRAFLRDLLGFAFVVDTGTEEG